MNFLKQEKLSFFDGKIKEEEFNKLSQENVEISTQRNTEQFSIKILK